MCISVFDISHASDLLPVWMRKNPLLGQHNGRAVQPVRGLLQVGGQL